VVVWHLEQRVVTVDELEILSLGHLHACVAGSADAAVLLSYIDDFVAISEQIVDRTDIRPIVNDNDFPLSSFEIQVQDAVDALAEHVYGQVVAGHDKTDQWLMRVVGHCHVVV